MAKKVIFRKIAGRIRALRVNKSQVDSSTLKASADIKKAIKKKVAGRTSTSLQRAGAVKAAREALDVKKREFIGRGTFKQVFKANKKAVKFDTMNPGRSVMGMLPDENSVVRAARQLTLGKQGTPTFLVKTRKREFLVQDVLNPKTITESKMNKLVDQITKKKGLTAADKKVSNFRLRKGKPRVADAGGVFDEENLTDFPKLTKKQKSRFRRFVIKPKRRK